jgi:DNA-binding NarL/FixJ family response regulator
LQHETLTDVTRPLQGIFAASIVVALLAAIDLGTDMADGTSVLHVVLEGSVAAIGLLGAVLAARRLRLLHNTVSRAVDDAAAARAEAEQLQARLTQSHADAERFRVHNAQLVRGLSDAIDEQLQRWHLTATEKEVALLLLKGLSHKEIADLRHTSEATARQQAGAVYKKSGLAGRNELSAFFLEDLLGPR